MGWERALAGGLLVAAATWVPADTLTTNGGQTHEGRIEFTADGLQVVTSTGPVSVPVADLKEATLDGEGASPPWRISGVGVLCVNGSFLAKRVGAISGVQVVFEPAAEGVQLTTANTAGVFFRPPGPWEARALRFERSGLLLRTGDFMEGRLIALEGDEVRTDSVLLGARSFGVAGEVAALVLRAPLPEEEALEVSLADGSVLRTTEWEWRDGLLVLNDSPFEGYRVPSGEVRALRRGSPRSFLDLLEERWKLEGQAGGEDPAPFTNDPRLANLGRAVATAHAIQKARTVELEQARKEWQAGQKAWMRKNNDVSRARNDTNRQRAQVRSKLQQVAAAKRSEQQARKDLEDKMRRSEKAARDLEAARKAMGAAGKDDAARRRAEAVLRNATQARKNAERGVSQGTSRHKGTLQRLQAAEKAHAAAEAQVRKAEEKERMVRAEAEQTQGESEAAKRRHDAAVQDHLRAGVEVREADARLNRARKALDQP